MQSLYCYNLTRGKAFQLQEDRHAVTPVTEHIIHPSPKSEPP